MKRLLLILFFLSFGLSIMAQSSCPDNHHPHMIDLGLPSGTKWACCNVGAVIPEGYGGYYAYGETEEKEVYDLYNYQFIHLEMIGKNIIRNILNFLEIFVVMEIQMNQLMQFQKLNFKLNHYQIKNLNMIIKP